MENTMELECVVGIGERSLGACAAITREGLVLREMSGQPLIINYAELADFRLLDYQVVLHTRHGEVRLSKMGRETEHFHEKLWQAYNQRCEESLFIQSKPSFEGEGLCSYVEQDISCQGIAKVLMYDDCLCIYPHDQNARRIPLCFSMPPIMGDYQLSFCLDTGDEYRVSKLGHHTQDVFDEFSRHRAEIVGQWEAAHRDLVRSLSARLGDAAVRYDMMKGMSGSVVEGIFSLNTDGFWFALLHDGKAAVEMVTGEHTATYLYHYELADDVFEHRLRHALESVALHREVIFADLSETPLYQMAVQRNYHLQYLREHHTGRIIHTAAWEKQLRSFFSR